MGFRSKLRIEQPVGMLYLPHSHEGPVYWATALLINFGPPSRFVLEAVHATPMPSCPGPLVPPQLSLYLVLPEEPRLRPYSCQGSCLCNRLMLSQPPRCLCQVLQVLARNPPVVVAVSLTNLMVLYTPLGIGVCVDI